VASSHFQQGGLHHSVFLNGERLATLVPISPCPGGASHSTAADRDYLLSRFAYTRRLGSEMSLESPLSHARILLHDWRAAGLVSLLGQPQRAESLSEQLPSLPAEVIEALLALLLNAQMLCELDDRGVSSEDETPALQTWEFHDLLFHARSRAGRHDSPTGGTYRFGGRLDPPPLFAPRRSGAAIDLYRPDRDRLEREDPPFAWVHEARRSVREYSEAPISDRQLGEFLYRVGRLADYREAEVPTPGGPVRMAYGPRPYPAGGALYELELYAAIQACENLSPGLYSYNPEQHQLEPVSGQTPSTEQLLRDAGRGTGIPWERLQVLLIITARFQRIAWKYESIAYSLILKHVGVLFQTMYLVATAMGLAPCAIGCGDADLFARAAGIDYYAETSVGEFLLGSNPTRHASPAEGGAA
jgi:SagB-type dehydrogenase family enzyme